MRPADGLPRRFLYLCELVKTEIEIRYRQKCGQPLEYYVERYPELPRIDTEQHLPRLYVLPLMNLHVPDEAGHVGGNHQLRGVHIGVVGSDVSAAEEP